MSESLEYMFIIPRNAQHSQYHDVEVEYWSESLKQQCLDKQQVRKFDFSYNTIMYSMTFMFSSEGISYFKPTFRGVSGQLKWPPYLQLQSIAQFLK